MKLHFEIISKIHETTVNGVVYRIEDTPDGAVISCFISSRSVNYYFNTDSAFQRENDEDVKVFDTFGEARVALETYLNNV
jgi:hypothetical protein